MGSYMLLSQVLPQPAQSPARRLPRLHWWTSGLCIGTVNALHGCLFSASSFATHDSCTIVAQMGHSTDCTVRPTHGSRQHVQYRDSEDCEDKVTTDRQIPTAVTSTNSAAARAAPRATVLQHLGSHTSGYTLGTRGSTCTTYVCFLPHVLTQADTAAATAPHPQTAQARPR